ncbi:nose resistant to fluoxetine protein 6-like isoform X2 [Belonocnema kinseyi]|uniref:nose resistant to fluoxetine protein 6-like isoform X2 n=1 Tax=Belonocnema kinseyi TaxID=2817044 RepID=UPI00143D89B8|nr:nose resistant to fluoxetine protein 6-like isoform X2 [Belonocnema kinseyi]
MASSIPKILPFYALLLYVLGIPHASADYREFLEQLKLEKMFHVMGPKELLLTFSNKTNRGLFYNEACKADILAYKSGLDKKEMWALRMLDASSKIPPGLLIGNFIEMGMYDECMEVYVNKTGSEIRGNHCTYVLHLSYKNKTLPVNPLLSICLPVSCQEKDLSNIIHKRMENTGSYQAYNVTSIEVHCSDVHVRDPTGAIITAKGILGIKIPKVLSEISLLKGAMDIFHMEDNPGSISALHGMRFLSTSIIIFGHGTIIRASSLHANNIDLAYLPTWQSFIMAPLYYSVDTFLTISGFLASYSFLKKHMVGKENFNIGQYYLHRYIRLMPAMAALTFTSIYIIPFIGSGPKWRKATKDITSDVCREKLWTVLLFVNNMVHKKKYCLVHLWSTAVDMQLFWISPLILYPLAKRPIIGLWILGTLFFASVITPAIVLAVNQFRFSLNSVELSFAHNLEMFENLYTQPHTRASAWLIGIFLGYFTIIGPKELKKSTILAGWTLTAAAALFCFIGFWSLVQVNYEYDVAYEAFFGALSRPIWSVGIAWIIFTSIHGYGGYVNKFLSLPIFFPLSRLSFCLYLVHIMVQLTNSQIARTPSYYIIFQQVTAFTVDLVLSLTVAFFICIVFEIPAKILEMFLLRKKTMNQKSKKEKRERIKKD